MKTQLFVGQSQLRGALSKYASRFNFLELRADAGRVPRPAVLRKWPEEVHKGFVFSVLLSRQVGQLGSNSEAALKFGLEVADALQAKWLVVQTDPTVGPSNRSRERLKALFSRLAEGGRSVAWEPHGAWQDEDAMVWAHELGVHLVHDITRGDPVSEPILYVRVPGLGTSARLGSGAIEKAAESLVDAREAYIVIGGDGAVRASQTLRAMLREQDSLDAGSSSVPDGPFVFDETSLAPREEDDSDELEEEWDDDAEDDDAEDDDVEDDDAEDDDAEEQDEADLPPPVVKNRKGAKRK